MVSIMKSRNTKVFIFSQITLITTINNCMKASGFVFCFWFFFILVCTDYYWIIKTVFAMKKYQIQVANTRFKAINQIEFPMMHVHVQDWSTASVCCSSRFGIF